MMAPARIMMTPRRRCLACSRPLSKHARADAKYCSDACRTTHWHRRGRTAQALARKCATCHRRMPIERRGDARFCSAACRQRDYRKRKTAAAHQLQGAVRAASGTASQARRARAL